MSTLGTAGKRKVRTPPLTKGILIGQPRMSTIVMIAATLIQPGCWRRPELSPNEAGTIISRAPEFNRTRSLVKVMSTTRGKDSLADCCFAAEFVFRSGGKIVKARAEFQYWGHEWHLQEFDYGSPPNVETIWIENDLKKYQ